MTPFKYCPTCSIKNRQKKLILRQINFKFAVYLCEDKECPYPEGYNLVEVKERSLTELINEKKELTDENDLDNWLEKYFASENKEQCNQIIENEIINEDDLSKIINEIDESHNENDLNVQCDNDLFTWIEDTFEQSNLKNKKSSCNDVEIIQSTTEISKSLVTNDGQFDLNYINNGFSNNQPQVDMETIVINDDPIKEYNKASSDKGPVVNMSSMDYQISNEKQDTLSSIKLKRNTNMEAKSNPPNLIQNVNNKNLIPKLVVCPKEKKFVLKQFVVPTKQTQKSIDFKYSNILIKPARIK